VAVEANLIDKCQIANAGNRVPDPTAFMAGIGGSETGREHDQIRRDSDKNAGTVQTSDESDVDDEQWVGQDPVYVSRPEHLSKILLFGIRNMLVSFVDNRVSPTDAVTCCHCKIGKERDSRDQRSQNVQQSFLLITTRQLWSGWSLHFHNVPLELGPREYRRKLMKWPSVPLQPCLVTNDQQGPSSAELDTLPLSVSALTIMYVFRCREHAEKSGSLQG
jgi:hypothetical protein